MINIKIPEHVNRVHINLAKDKCPYCMALFNDGDSIGCLSKSEFDLIVTYTSFFADLNRAIRWNR